MSQSVTIKSNKYGINLVLDPEIGFDELLKDVVEKFKASSTFFKNAKLALSFEGRKLSEEEEQQIISAIESNTSIEILCIVENGTRQEAVMKEQVEAFYDAVQQQYENAAAGNGQPRNISGMDSLCFRMKLKIYRNGIRKMKKCRKKLFSSLQQLLWISEERMKFSVRK